MTANYVYYYSNRCDTCTQFTRAFAKTPIAKQFVCINIDNPAIKITHPITKVPAIVINGYMRPLEANDAFDWLKSYINSIVNNGNDNINSNALAHAQLPSQAQAPSTAKTSAPTPADTDINRKVDPPSYDYDKVMSFDLQDMYAYSDQFSYINDDDKNDFNKSYSLLNQK
jgi:hypothetical protein